MVVREGAPIIAIASRVADDVFDGDLTLSRENAMCLKTYIDAIEAAGGVPVILPILPHPEDYYHFIQHCISGVLLPGGNDCDPSLFNEDPGPHTGRVRPKMDQLDIWLVQTCHKLGVPLLGICRGMQLINVAFGGSILQDLGELNANHDWHGKDRSAIAHPLRVETGTQLARALRCGTTVQANSLHHQAVNILGKGLIASALAPDGVVEGIELARHEHPFLVGVQCHPEELWTHHPHWANLFETFVNTCVSKLKY